MSSCVTFHPHIVGQAVIRILAAHPLCGAFGCLQGAHSSGKPGKVREFDIGQGKIREIVVCLWFAAAVVIIAK